MESIVGELCGEKNNKDHLGFGDTRSKKEISFGGCKAVKKFQTTGTKNWTPIVQLGIGQGVNNQKLGSPGQDCGIVETREFMSEAAVGRAHE